MKMIAIIISSILFINLLCKISQIKFLPSWLEWWLYKEELIDNDDDEPVTYYEYNNKSREHEQEQVMDIMNIMNKKINSLCSENKDLVDKYCRLSDNYFKLYDKIQTNNQDLSEKIKMIEMKINTY